MVVSVMRIITGRAKGRRLVGPRGSATRPMQDRVKEAIFSSLAAVVPGAEVLDLYAGSGSMGLEALSRGAASATFVESDRTALDALRRNVAAVGLGGDVRPITVERFLAANQGRYDVVFVDPPYGVELTSVEAVLAGVAKLMAKDAIAIVHRPAGERQPDVPGLWLADRRLYGGARLWRMAKTSKDNGPETDDAEKSA